MGKRKRRIEGFAFYDHREICNHLEQMAEKGWMIWKIGVFWEYEAIEPRKMHFAVSCCAGEDRYFKGDRVPLRENGFPSGNSSSGEMEAGVPFGRNGGLLLRRGRSSAFWQYGKGRTGSSSYDYEKKKSAILAAGFCDGFITGMDLLFIAAPGFDRTAGRYGSDFGCSLFFHRAPNFSGRNDSVF